MRRPAWNRVHGLILILQDRHDAAIQACGYIPDQDSQQAAALRGKAVAYREAIKEIQKLERGELIHRNRRWRREDKDNQ